MARDDTHSGQMARALPLADCAALHQALAEANIPTLLMVYVHLTHDEAMLDRFASYIRPAFSGQPTEIPEADAENLRSRLQQLLTSPGAAAKGAPSHQLMQKMMSVGVGEPVADEFIPLLLEQMGFELPPARKRIAGRPLPPPGFRVLVIGAGLTGLAAGIKLAEAGYDYVTIEKNADVGGTWFENVYPGVGVDTPSHFYSYSFELNPEWHHYFPKGKDMQAYFLRVAEKYRLRDKIRFETRVVACVYDEASGLWTVTVKTKDGREEALKVNAVINAHGPVNRWSWPKLPGFEDFKGPKMHTAGWDPSVDLKGKKVAVIGTGASGSQLVPAIAAETAHLTVFMRSKHWVLFNPEYINEVSEGCRWAMRHIPHYLEWFRFRVYWAAGDGLFINVLKDPNWPADSPSVSAVNDTMRNYGLWYLQQKFADRPDLMAKLLPDCPIFSKRIVLDNGWFDALKRDNVSLEDQPIERVLPNGIRMKDGRVIEVDVIACATGFDVSKMLGSLTVIGKDGRSLGEEWGPEDPRAYMGMTVPGYPNFFLTVGPNSAPNHAAGQNLISEAQIHFIIECLDLVVANKAKSIEPTQKAYQDWNDQIDNRMKEMIWTHPKANSYYNNSRGRVFLSFPYRLVDYWTWTRDPKRDHFTLN